VDTCAADVRGIRFPRSSVLKRGYDTASVDELLTRVAAAVDALPSS
jgi:DivIVA domain-containing protein